MSTPKVGDRVRVVIEDTVYINRDGSFSLSATVDIRVGEFGVVSIEVIEQPFVLPTKLWAQVLDSVGQLWTRKYLDESVNPEWANLSGSYLSSKRLRESRGALRVISEGVDDE